MQADEIELDRDVPLIPHAAHYFLQLLNGILEFAPDDSFATQMQSAAAALVTATWRVQWPGPKL